MNTLKRLAASPAFWIGVVSVLTALGVQLPEELKQQLPIIGPLLVG